MFKCIIHVLSTNTLFMKQNVLNFTSELCRLVLFGHATTSFSDHQRQNQHKSKWDTGTSAVFFMEFWFVSLGRSGYLYMELGVFNSGKVTK